MNATSQLESIFFAALEKGTAEERAAYLHEACAGDEPLQRRIERMIEAQKGSFLNAPAGEAGDTASLPLIEGPGTVIGPYKLLQKIGEGGMGVVYMAEQTHPVSRHVALKVIKPGMDSREVLARFEAERQALAMMDHPNIAKVLDAGTTESGRPYFVMELVKGVPITQYCDEKHWTLKERIELFVPVCQAIQHAHQKGIIHRDLKPSNVLVAEYDNEPVPKVIDFGVAKATAQKLTERTMFTQFGQVLGTVEYMSPEQAKLNQLDIDTRSDIYSLGVLLYELVTGTTPFERKRLQTAAFDEMLRIIREEEPPRPSTRLSTTAELRSIAVSRSSEPKKLSGLVKGELDWIVMKALDKDRNRRYETANGLAMDIQRYLDDEPILARPATSLYRFHKLVCRNKLAVAAASAVIAALALGLSVSTWMFFKERDAHLRSVAAEQQAKSEAAKSGHVAAFMKSMVNGVGPSVALGRDTTMLREIVDQTAHRVEQDLKDQPAVEADLRATLGNVYFDLGEYHNAEAMHRKALILRKKLLGDEHPNVADTLNDLGKLFYGQGKYADAAAAHREALAIRRERFGNEHLVVAQSLNNLAVALRRQGPSKLAESERLFREALAMRKKLLGNEHADVAESLNDLGLLFFAKGTHSEAEATHREALAMRRRLFGSEHPDVAMSVDRLGLALTYQGKSAEAEAAHREGLAIRRKLFGNEHPDLANSLHNLAIPLIAQGKFVEAETLEREALAIRRKVLSNEHVDVARLLGDLADLLGRQGKYAEAEAMLRERLQGLRSRGPGDHPQIGDALASLTLTLLAAEKFAEAEVAARECLDLREKKRPDDWQTFNTRSMLGGSLLGQKKYVEAEPLLLAAYAGMKQHEDKLAGLAKPRLTEALERLVQLYEATGKPDKAAEWKRRLAEFNQVETEKTVEASAATKQI